MSFSRACEGWVRFAASTERAVSARGGIVWRTSGTILMARLVAVLVIAAGLLLVAPLPPVWPLAVIAIGLTAVVVWEQSRPPVGERVLDEDAAFA